MPHQLLHPGATLLILAAVCTSNGCSNGDNQPATPTQKPTRATLQALLPYVQEGKQGGTARIKGDEDLKEITNEGDLPAELQSRTALTGATGPNLIPAVLGDLIEIAGTVAGKECINVTKIKISQVQPGGILKDDVAIELKPLTRTYFDDVIQKQVGIDVGFLAFTGSMAKNDRAEVLIQDVAGMEIANFNAQADPTRLQAARDAALPQGVCGRYVLTSASATAVSHRVYSDQSLKAAIVAALNIGGHTYSSRNKQQTDYFIGVGLQPLKVLGADPPLPPKKLDAKLLAL
jgi:hypothetical protein